MEIISYYFLLLIIYSFIGWAYESILCSITQKTLVNRGFLNGPICPIYGFGALTVILLLQDIRHNLVALFLASVVLTGVLEYLTSYGMEKLFHAKWWDYSDQPFNINGRVCLLGAVVFGTMSVVLIHLVNPWICSYLDRLSPRVLYLSSSLLFALSAVDFTATVVHLLRMNHRLKEIQKAINAYSEQSKLALVQEAQRLKNALEEKLGDSLEEADKLKSILEEKLENMERFKSSLEERLEAFEGSEFHSERIRSLLSVRQFQDRRIMKAFPKMRSTSYREAFDKLKNRLFTPEDTDSHHTAV